MSPSSPLKTAGRWLLVVAFCFGLFVPQNVVLAATPVVDANFPLNLPVNATATIGAAFLRASSPATPTPQIIYTLSAVPARGVLKLNGVPLAAGAAFSQNDLDMDLLTFTALADVGRDQFVFRVSNGSSTSNAYAYVIHINRPEPTLYPAGFAAQAGSANQITVTWTDVPGEAAPDGYLVVCGNWAPVPPEDTSYPQENSNCTDGNGSVHVPPGMQSFTWDGLYSETNYTFAIFPYTESVYAGNPASFFDYLTSAGWPEASASTFITYSISGNTSGLMGVLVNAGGGHTALSGEDGSYTITGLEPGGYILTASIACYKMEPAIQAVMVSDLNNHVGSVDFTATALPCIRGTITENGSPMAGVVVSDGAGSSATTLEDGSYAFTAPTSGWSGTLAPAKINHFFTPFTRAYDNLSGDQWGQDYAASPLEVSALQFTAVWESIPAANGYLLDVATDPDFTQYVPGFQSRNVGEGTQYQVTGLSPHTHYFYRVIRLIPALPEEYSPVTEVLTRWGCFFPLTVHAGNPE